MEKVFVVGAGQMGSGIAQAMATNGKIVRMYDILPEIPVKSKEKMGAGLQKMVDKGKMTAEKREAILANILPTADMNDAADCDFAIEAASERLEIKKSIFEKLDAIMPAHAIIASNTSSISITTLAAATKRPAQFCGMHFFNPVHAMKLVEVVRGLLTSDETAAEVKKLAEDLGKTPVVCKDSPGFVVNRLFDPMLNEAAYLVAEGVAEPKDIDLAMVNGLNHPMGPLALMDLIGVDVIYNVMQVLYNNFGDTKYRPCPLLKQMVDANLLGRKTGKGFYEY